jgi:hypothetical protein
MNRSLEAFIALGSVIVCVILLMGPSVHPATLLAEGQPSKMYLPLVLKNLGPPGTLTVTSTAFTEGGTIPDLHTCKSSFNWSPPLAWTSASGTQSFALIMDDPDAPGGTFVHWVLFNIPSSTTSLTANANVPPGAARGLNDFGAMGYGGPCPPPGDPPHRYYFKIYALAITLMLGEGATKAQVEAAMAGNILAQGQLMGRFGQ